MQFGRRAQPQWQELETAVLIVGGGPVGLLSSILLARCGIRSTVIERYPTRRGQPKSHVMNPRSMEILRQAGLDTQALRRLGTPPDEGHVVRFVTSVAGLELGTLPYDKQDESALEFTPEPLFHLSQPLLEDFLYEAAIQTGLISVWKDLKWEGCASSAGGLESQVTHTKTGAKVNWKSKYLLCCDGSRATSRELLSIPFGAPAEEGVEEQLFHFVSVHIDLDLRHLKPAVLWWIFSLKQKGRTFICYDRGSSWVYCISYDPATQSREIFTDAYCRQQIDEAIGEQVTYNILSTTFWSTGIQVAQAYQSPEYTGAFVLGDAAHIFPPSGGLGINTGFADAHNLIWKIDAVQKGWADAAVLGTYSQERRPVALANGRFSTANWLKMLALAREIHGPDLQHPEDPEERIKDPALRRAITEAIKLNHDHFNSVKLQIGYVYNREIPAVPDASIYEPVFETGARLPHMWLNLNGSTVSSLDLVDGKSFVVIASAGFVAPPLPWNSVGTRQIPVRIYQAVIDFSFVDSHWAESTAFKDTTGAWVIRPDQHILNSIADYKELETAINAYLGQSQ
ncbi:FAD binding domain-containing protein [Aspergillus heterothallicus]